MDLSFIILTWNSEKYISKCLNSIFEDSKIQKLQFEIIIVDNGSKDSTVKIIETYQNDRHDLIIPIYLAKNTGTTYSRNIALKRSKGDFIVIMDSDVEISIGTIEQLICTMKKNRKSGIVSPMLIYPNGTLQKSTDVFPTVMRKMFRLFFLKNIEKNENILINNTETIEVDYAISALWMLRRDIIDKVGFLDENIFYAPEDVDYCLRIWKAGYKVIYEPRVSCVHHAQEISRRIKISKGTIYHLAGLMYYFKKHKYLFRKPFHIGKYKKWIS